MNNPPYIITDVMGDVVDAVRTSLGGNLQYHYGYVTELNETLMQHNNAPSKSLVRFPLVWLAQPFTITTGVVGIYGEIEELRLFIMTDSKPDYKAPERMQLKYKAILYPILNSLLDAVSKHRAFQVYREKMKVKATDRYWWGENQQSVLSDVVDVIELRIFGLKVNNNSNC